jgi:hypothetical protein
MQRQVKASSNYYTQHDWQSAAAEASYMHCCSWEDMMPLLAVELRQLRCARREPQGKGPGGVPEAVCGAQGRRHG